MDADSIFPILMLLIIGGACLLAGVLLFGVGWMFSKFIRRGEPVFQSANRALAEDSGNYFTEAQNQLLPWEPDALHDFAAHLAIEGRRIGPSLHYRGTLKSLKQPETFGWLAFDLQLKFGKGSMKVCTAQSAYQIEIAPNTAKVRVDGIPLGQIHTRGDEITLLGVDGRPLGRYQHQRTYLGLRVSVKVYYLRPGYFDPTYSPVEVGGRQVAEFNNNLILSQHLKFSQKPVPQVYQNLASDISSEELDWLLALLGLEIYYRINRHLSDKSR